MKQEMKKLFSKNSLFFKYFCSYVLALIIPLVAITTIMLQINQRMYRKEITDRTTAVTENIKQIVDIKTNELMTLTVQAFSNSTIANVDYSDYINSINRIQAELNNYVCTNGYIREMAIYNPEDGYVYSSLSSTSFDTYSNIVYQFADYSGDTLKNHLKSDDKVLYLPVRTRVFGSEEYYACIIKESAIYGKNSGRIAVIILDTNYISELLKNVDGDSYVFDSDEKCITDNTSSFRIPAENIINAVEKNKIVYDKKPYFLNSVESDVNGWQYVFLYKYSDTFKNLVTIQWIYLLVLLLTVGAWVYIVIYSLKHVYNPIKSMAERLQNYGGIVLNEYNELETMKYNVEHIVQAKNELEKKVENAYEIAQEYMFFKLINGSLGDVDEVKNKFEFYGIRFEFDYYYIAMFGLDDYVPDIIGNIEKMVNDYISINKCFSSVVFETNKLCVICPAMNKAHNDEDRQMISEIKEFLETVTMGDVSVGVGGMVDNISVLWKSYIEAKTAFDYKSLKGTGKIIFFEDINRVTDDRVDFNKEIRKIKLYVKGGDTENTFKIIDGVGELLHNASLHTAKKVCFELITAVRNTVAEDNGEPDDDDLYLNRFDITTLTEFESADKLIAEVKKFLRGFFDAAPEKNDDYLLERIITYIDENYNKPFFSVDNVAQHFEISNTYLGQYFKGKKGITVSAYATKVQMEAAKKMLAETDITIKELALRVGFTDVSNFIRKFKSQVGVPPGVYRKGHEKN